MPPELIPGASVFDVTSAKGEDYRVFVWQPPGTTERKRPAVVLLDGNATFPIAAATAALQSRRPERTGVTPAVIVGIGYRTDRWLDPKRRTYDYTPAVTAERLPERPNEAGWSDTGGADKFLAFLGDELLPLIESEYGADRSRSSLFGHSFGGLFTLHTLFTHPNLFRSYIAASPSIWFSRELLGDESRRFAAASAQGRRLLITVGSLEQSQARACDGSSSEHDTWVERNRMVDSARALAAELAMLNKSKLAVTFTEFADENHASVVPAAISRALRFALAAGDEGV